MRYPRLVKLAPDTEAWSALTDGCAYTVVAMSVRGLLEGMRDHLVYHHEALVEQALADRLIVTPEHRAIQKLWAQVGDE